MPLRAKKTPTDRVGGNAPDAGAEWQGADENIHEKWEFANSQTTSLSQSGNALRASEIHRDAEAMKNIQIFLESADGHRFRAVAHTAPTSDGNTREKVAFVPAAVQQPACQAPSLIQALGSRMKHQSYRQRRLCHILRGPGRQLEKTETLRDSLST